MEGKIDRGGRVTLQWDIMHDKLLSPDGTLQCLPCEHCGQPMWCKLETVSVLCGPCGVWVRETGEEFNKEVR